MTTRLSLATIDTQRQANTLRNNMENPTMNITINTLNLTVNVNSLVDTSTPTNKALTSAIASVIIKNTSKAYFDSLQIGSFVESEGGYYTGLIKSDYDGRTYALFLAPNGIGDNNGNTMKIHSSSVAIAGTDYLSDGWMNTNALVAVNAGSTYAGGWSRSLVINGKDDWYLPSRDELETCYRIYKPGTTDNYTGGSGNNSNSVSTNTVGYTSSVPAQTRLIDFKTGGGSQAFKTANYYWTSTQYCSGTYGSWIHHFSNGFQNWNYKSNGYYVRAVRRVLVQE